MATPEQIQKVKELFPAFSWMLDVPDLANIITQAADEQWAADRIQGALQGTQWFKDRSALARQWTELLQSDPAEARKQQSALAVQMRQWASSVGLTVSADEAMYIASLSLGNGESQAEWQANIYRQYTQAAGQKPTVVVDQLKARAYEYAIPLSDSVMLKWSQDIATGMADMNTYESYLREQAKSLFPSLSNAIDRGITVNQYVQPYAQVAVQELGINPQEIDWRDPKWNMAIQRTDPKTGTSTAMSLADWTREIRTNDVFGYDKTPKAQEQATMLSQALLQRFGSAA